MNHEYYYIASSNDSDRQVISVSSGIYNMDTFTLPVQQITPSFYDKQKEKRHEKNWAFVKYKNVIVGYNRKRHALFAFTKKLFDNK